ncbi:DJ-1/PfpI family protein [Psychrobacter phenylpyruvicus]|uniref:Transcriptional activator FtrA n=1 Tax=Psychrobacter phenylpyruvicus TaxID=29432 RepID=A0A379LGY2_9GAMM|nr:DJ-1/PfpI family protein [Psychrobacter phenylpyruvicus]SUD89859.1 transcriptional activator FtrA [Psychrobacter phenylpyruvicus]
MQHITALVFNDFETLDLFGPVEMLGSLKDNYSFQFCSIDGGLINSVHGVPLATTAIADLPNPTDILLVVGGFGTRQLVEDSQFLETLRNLANEADWVLSVCTGSALLAKAGLLDGRQATSNKIAWEWATSQSDKVNWIKKARWVVDGKYYTSAGVSAGMDMALAFISDRHGKETAAQVVKHTEYRWTSDSGCD